MTRLLLVEDDLMTLDALREVLEQEGYEVLTATNGAVAFEKVLVEHPDIVLFDIMLPVVTGQDLVDSLLDRVTFPPILIGMSASNYNQWCGSRSIAHFFKKPFLLDDLLQVLRTLTLPP